MDEVRCPMCSKENPADAEECEFCGARIKPLIIQQPPEESPPRSEQLPPSPVEEPSERLSEEPQEEPMERTSEETDWLTRMRFGVESESEIELDVPEDDEGLKRGETDLLGRFRDLGISDEDQRPEDAFSEAPEPEVSFEAEADMPVVSEDEPPAPVEPEPELDLTPPEVETRSEGVSPEEGLPQVPAREWGDDTEREEPVVPDWLARIRARKEEEEAAAPPSTGDTDWLTGLREVSLGEEEEGEELVETFDEVFPLDDTPEIETGMEPLGSEESIQEEPSAQDMDEEIDSAQTSIEDLFSELDMHPTEGDEPAEAEIPADHVSPFVEGEDLLDVDDLFKDFEIPTSEDREELQDVDLFAEPSTPSTTEEDSFIRDDLFAEIEASADALQEQLGGDLFGDLDEKTIEEDEPLIDADFLADLGIEVEEDVGEKQELDVLPEPPQPEEEVSRSEIVEEADFPFDSSDIQELAPGSDALAKDSAFEEFDSDAFTPFEAKPLEEMPSDESSLSDLLGDFSPSWMDDTVKAEDDELPHVPALILDDEMPPLDAGAGEGDTASMEIPAWLQNLGKDVEEDLDEEEELPVLAKAKLPPWLEAMRPIESMRAPHEIELELEEEEEIIEAAGPLAGLKGVLLAEPVVAMPRTPIVSLGALDISDRDLNHADILQSMVEEEESEEGRPTVRSVPLPILRWVCAVILLLSVTIPSVMEFPRFKTPFELETPRQPRELPVTLTVIDSVPFDQPALLIFDYDPSFSAEMDAVAGALVEDLFARDQPVISLSTQPSGPMLADRMFKRVGAVHAGINGEDYLHFGYLAGGSTALQLFATSPKEALLGGFNLPENFEGETVWDSPLLESINGISDFALVAVISSGTENARNWAEQVHPLLGDTPLIMVISAGVEPLIHPYYEAEDPQIDGILSGLPSALIYEGFNGLQADAFQRWSSYGSGVLMAALILMVGAVYGAVSWIIQRSNIRQS